MLDKGVFSGLTSLCETYDENLMLISSVVIAMLSSAKDMDELLVLNNCLSYIQSLMTHCHRSDGICHLVLALCNIAPAIVGPEAEVAMRLVFQATKKLDLTPRSMQKAQFIADVISDFSRLNHYSSLLVDEGALPLLLHFIDTYSNLDAHIIDVCAETMANLSMNRKNRREIASSGIASRLAVLFEKGSHATCASILLLMGNLLSSNLFHDKVANTVTITNMLDNLLDINYPKQFNAVCYCLCQLSKNHISADMMVQCHVIPIIIGYLHNCPVDSIDYLWTVLQNITAYPQFFNEVMAHNEILVKELYEEIRYDNSSVHQMLSIVKISLNVTQYEQFYTYLDQPTLELFIKTIKSLLSPSVQFYSYVQYMALISLVYLARYCSSSRSLILSTDLIEVFTTMGIEDDFINVKYAELLHIISNEESCCYRLLDMNIQRFLSSLQDSFQRLVLGQSQSKTYKKPEKRYAKGGSVADLTAIINTMNMSSCTDGPGGGRPSSPSTTLNHLPSTSAMSMTNAPVVNNINNMSLGIITNSLDGVEEGEQGKALTAATLHNIALKRPVLAPGTLTMILSLAKNCKSLRVLHCIRTLAQMSIYNKSKIQISKEFKKIVPMLTVIMRFGVMEAEKVQYYAAIILCNILSLTLDKTLLQELVKSNAITDLMVVTLLRINAINTKETLAKTFYNLLGRVEIRETLVLQMDILSAILELIKLEFTDLLELCIRAIFNLSCELKPGSGTDTVYAQKFSSHKIPQLLINRIVFNANMPGSLPTRPIRLLLGMCVANMSFHKTLVIEMINIQNNLNSGGISTSIGNNANAHANENKLSDALYRIFAISSDESTYCAVVSLYNISKLPDSRVLADSKAVPLCVEILHQESSILNIQLAVSALCNFSMYPIYHEQLTNVAAPALMKILASPTIHLSVKIDIIQCVYNIIHSHNAACAVFIQCEVAAALWKLLKVFGGGKDKDGKDNKESRDNKLVDDESVEDEESIYVLISHIVRILCNDAGNPDASVKLNKLLADGTMNIILRLAKLEIVTVKVDMSFSMYALTKGSEGVKLLKRDAVDILFWLTLFDTLGCTNMIYQNIARSLRSFAINSEEAVLLIKQERFLNILKVLVKSKHEDILWQTSGIVYNLMQVNFCLQKLLSFGLIAFIFEMAAANFHHVKHVCSACLHIVPEHLPNIEDPLVLDLILSLLEAQGDKFSDVSKKPTDSLAYPYPSIMTGSRFSHAFTPFAASWTPFTCLLDTSFTPAQLPNQNNLALFSNIDIPPVDPSQINTTDRHWLLSTKQYQDFNVELRNCGGSNNSSAHNMTDVSKTNTQNAVDSNGAVAICVNVPPVMALIPPLSTLSNSSIPTGPSASPPNSRPMSNQLRALSPLLQSTSSKDRLPSKGGKRSRTSTAASTFSVLGNTMSNKSVSLPLITAPAALPDDTVGAIHKSILVSSKVAERKSRGSQDFSVSKSQSSLYAGDSFVSLEASSFSRKGAALPSEKK
ncbi:hypothetical protein EON64_03270 [archaeon]|nr:MAG: hypothetical protein EON64_03270 [archaeon]